MQSFKYFVLAMCYWNLCIGWIDEPQSIQWWITDYLPYSPLSIESSEEPDVGSVPWFAQIVQGDTYLCGGVIISRRVVLTAAHCVTDGHINDDDDVSVLVGSTLKMTGQKYESCVIKAHSKYFQKDLPYYYHDVALILLKTNIEFNRKVQRAKLITNSNWKDTNYLLKVAGFGKASNDKYLAQTLQMAALWFVDGETCDSDEENKPLPVHMFCAISDGPAADCFGDSGAGVMWKDYVVGIVVVGHAHQCSSNAVPTKYTNIFYYRGWIEDSVQELESRTLGKCKKRSLETELESFILQFDLK